MEEFEPGLDLSFNMDADSASRWAKENAALLVTRVDSTTRKRINGLVAKALESGE
jgi:hypothetical protein